MQTDVKHRFETRSHSYLPEYGIVLPVTAGRHEPHSYTSATPHAYHYPAQHVCYTSHQNMAISFAPPNNVPDPNRFAGAHPYLAQRLPTY
jgi:hypothetical protein